MTQLNGNLIPTQIVDKNGHITTRHMKATGASLSAQNIPLVSLVGSSDTAPADAPLSAQDIIWPDGENVDEVSLNFMIEHEEGLLDTLTTLQTKGNEAGMESVRGYLKESFSAIEEDLSKGTSIDNVASVKEAYSFYNEVTVAQQLVKVWAIGTVRSDLKSGLMDDYYDNDFLDGLDGVSLMVYGDSMKAHPRKESDTEYWRGATVLYMANLDYYRDDIKSDSYKFMKWAGKRQDIDEILEAIKDIDSVDTTTLEGLLVERQKILAPNLRNGAL